MKKAKQNTKDCGEREAPRFFDAGGVRTARATGQCNT